MTFAKAVQALDLKAPMTREPVGPDELISILKEDLILAVERPGSWEGANMLELLVCHGLLNHQD